MKTRVEIETELSTLVSSKLESSIKEKGFATLLVSGGSTPVQLFHLLSEKDLDWKKVTIVPVDERFLPDEHPDQNGNLIKKHLLINKAAVANFCPLILNVTDSEINLNLVKRSIESVGHPFTVVILGMGTDGHTASLFPCSPELEQGLDLSNTNELLITNPKKAPYQRITFTKKALLSAENIYLHCYGAEKKKILDSLDSFTEKTYPIKTFMNQQNNRTELFWTI